MKYQLHYGADERRAVLAQVSIAYKTALKVSGAYNGTTGQLDSRYVQSSQETTEYFGGHSGGWSVWFPTIPDIPWIVSAKLNSISRLFSIQPSVIIGSVSELCHSRIRCSSGM